MSNRTILTTNETTPPPGLLSRVLTKGDPYNMTDITERSPKDWGRIEAYTQGSLSLKTHVEPAPKRIYFDTCVFTHLDFDHLRSALWSCTKNISESFEQERAASFDAALCQNMVLYLPETNITASTGVFRFVNYNAHADLKPTNILQLYADLLDKEADVLDGYERYQTADWDGHDAEPIAPETLDFARKLMSIIPTSLGRPDAAPAGDGSIALEWVPEDTEHKLDRLFLDIGPGAIWRAYWSLRTGEFERVTGEGCTDETKSVLDTIFEKLST